MRILIGVLIYRKGAYILDKFLSNQAKIQQQSPSSELVIATAEHDFAGELESMMNGWQLKGRMLTYEIVKPVLILPAFPLTKLKKRLWMGNRSWSRSSAEKFPP